MNIRQVHFLKHILILSAFAGVLGLLRFVMTDQSSYLWLNWNLFLALLPILFAWLAIKNNKKWIAFIMVLLWLGFLPNAPYIITDFIHLADVGPKSSLWYDGLMIFMYSLAGISSWVLSTHLLVRHYFWKPWVIGFISLLTGFGIYLGRYLRLNTWYVVTNPLEIFEQIGSIFLYPGKHEPVISMTLAFAVALGVMYYYLHLLLSYEKTTD